MRAGTKKTFVGTCALLIALYFVRPIYIYATSGPEEQQDKCLLEGQPKDPRKEPRPNVSGKVKVIQLTDVGEFAIRCQFTDALYEVNWDRDVDPPPDFHVEVKVGAKEKSKPKFVVLYIHGWHNDASEREDNDLPRFRKSMTALAEANPEKQVTGIYVSWNANSDIPLWHYLDFWQKEARADRIAASGNVTNIISAISEIVARSKVGGKFITIGHSFGARILVQASAQSIIVATQRAHPGRPNKSYQEVKSLSQTTILLNPAFEAAYFTPLSAFNRPEEQFVAEQKPVMLTIATSNDWATTYAFPTGQWLAWRTAEKEVYTLGNFEKFWTHSLEKDTSSECASAGRAEGLTEHYKHDDVCLKRTKGFPYNPFMVVRTQPAILSGHNGIWDKKFSSWLFGYIDELSKQLPPQTAETKG